MRALNVVPLMAIAMTKAMAFSVMKRMIAYSFLNGAKFARPAVGDVRRLLVIYTNRRVILLLSVSA